MDISWCLLSVVSSYQLSFRLCSSSSFPRTLFLLPSYAVPLISSDDAPVIPASFRLLSVLPRSAIPGWLQSVINGRGAPSAFDGVRRDSECERYGLRQWVEAKATDKLRHSQVRISGQESL